MCCALCTVLIAFISIWIKINPIFIHSLWHCSWVFLNFWRNGNSAQSDRISPSLLLLLSQRSKPHVSLWTLPLSSSCYICCGFVSIGLGAKSHRHSHTRRKHIFPKWPIQYSASLLSQLYTIDFLCVVFRAQSSLRSGLQYTKLHSFNNILLGFIAVDWIEFVWMGKKERKRVNARMKRRDGEWKKQK